MSHSVRPHRRQPTRSPVPGSLQARTLEWGAISFSNAWKWKVKVKLLSRVWLFSTPWTATYQAPPSMGFSRQEYWSGVPLPSPPIYATFWIYDFFVQCTSLNFYLLIWKLGKSWQPVNICMHVLNSAILLRKIIWRKWSQDSTKTSLWRMFIWNIEILE